MSQVNPSVRKVCKAYIRGINPPNFKFNLFFHLDSNSDIFSNLPISTKIEENEPDLKDGKMDLDSLVREMDFEKITESKNKSMHENLN